MSARLDFGRRTGPPRAAPIGTGCSASVVRWPSQWAWRHGASCSEPGVQTTAAAHDLSVSDAIERLIDRYGPGPVCTVLAPLLTADRIVRIDHALAARLTSVVTILEDTYDPHNASATI